jgi:hypothetical protein
MLRFVIALILINGLELYWSWYLIAIGGAAFEIAGILWRYNSSINEGNIRFRNLLNAIYSIRREIH